METWIEWDIAFFLFLHHLQTPFLDIIFWYASSKYIWIPLYIFFIYVIVKKFPKEYIGIILLTGLTILFCDQFSSSFCKPFFERLRPSHNVEISHQVHIINGYRGGLYGFISSHAANSFGLAGLLYFFFRENKTKYLFLLLIWAFFVSYSRIYLGVHYPLDILAGALSGILIAMINYKTYRYFFRKKTTPSLYKQ